MLLDDIRFHHEGITVANLEQAIAWYERVLGFTLERRFPIPMGPAGETQVAMVKRGPMRIELLCPPEPIPQSRERWTAADDLKTTGNKHLAIAVRNVDSLLPVLKEASVDIESTGHYPWGTNIFIRDPFGSLIELVEQPDLF
ncbi:hypothetical protein AO069_27065 [Pseudomonas syringae pv. syringae PD2774]|uniref:VOC family protein n=1 Tax=Pseudomonas syringae TaxID=317 RepID=UPI0007374664|nr:VOC family protein [Pseudomonas syringae]KTB79596.1 hypothetical protein AO069_27065 [Pseudomonas syringae pv. syringae PD2774]